MWSKNTVIVLLTRISRPHWSAADLLLYNIVSFLLLSQLLTVEKSRMIFIDMRAFGCTGVVRKEVGEKWDGTSFIDATGSISVENTLKIYCQCKRWRGFRLHLTWLPMLKICMVCCGTQCHWSINNVIYFWQIFYQSPTMAPWSRRLTISPPSPAMVRYLWEFCGVL
jgi:hypothetical protein